MSRLPTRLFRFICGIVLSLEALSMNEISFEQAHAVATEMLAATAPEHDFVLTGDEARKYPFGWVFSFAPRKFLYSKDRRDLVPGYGPLVVDSDGSVEFLPSSVPPETAIRLFLQKWQAARERR